MKILFVDTKTTGHHMNYLNALLEIADDCCIVMSDELSISKQNCRIYNVQYKHSVECYLKWLSSIKKIAEEEKVDIIHFLYGDIFYKFFGIGLKQFKEFKVIITFHHMTFDTIRNISVKRIFRGIDNGVVHTHNIKFNLDKLKIINAIHIEYPHFNELSIENKETSMDYFGLKPGIPVLGAIGGTRYDKGLDILLEALNSVDSQFQLLIAGREETYKREVILNKCKNYRGKVKLYLKFLSLQELSMAFSAVDFIILPYRKIFDGASGPLGDGVWFRKPIIGSNHGSIGDIVITNDLGYVFETEDVNSLSKTLDFALRNGFNWNNKAEAYREQLRIENFVANYEKLYKI